MPDEIISVEDLRQDPTNARTHTQRGLKTLVDSLHEVGAARSGVIDEEGRILAGNLTWEALAEAGIERVRVVETDGKEWVVVKRSGLSDQQKKKLAYYDNRTAEFSDWSAEQLLDDLEAGLELDGLFYDGELDELLDGLRDEGHTELEDMPEALPGVAALKLNVTFESDLPWDIPALLPEMLASIPQPVDTWAGPDVCEDDGLTHWLYCWGSDSTRGLPMERTLLGFYVDDARFEKFWWEPDLYTAKVLNAGIDMAISPNFSLWHGAARATHLYNIFRSRWIGRYFQEAGIKVIPDVNWSTEASFEFCLWGIPEKPPAIAVQLQTLRTQEDKVRATTGLGLALERLQPRQLLVYSGPSGPAIVDDLGPACEVVFVPNRVQKRRAVMDRGKEVKKI